MTILAGPGIWE